MGSTNPDPGLVRALKICQIPKGPAVDLGCGSGRNTWLMAKRFPTIGYELDSHFRGKAEETMRTHDVSFEFKLANALSLKFTPETLAVVGIGMTIYDPKDVVENLLRRAYAWLMPSGAAFFWCCLFSKVCYNAY